MVSCFKCGSEFDGNLEYIDLKDEGCLCENCINKTYASFNFRNYIKEHKEQYVGIFKIIRIVRKLLISDRDSVIAVSGLEGEGKSVNIQNMMAILDPKFDVERNTIFMPTEEEVREKIFKLPPFTGLSLDEAMKVLYKRGWQSKERRQLNILFSTCRKRNLAFFFAIPNFWDLDAYYRDHRVKLWIFVPVRGKAMVMVRDDNPYAEDPWWRKKNQSVINKFSRYSIIMDKTQLINAIRKIKNCKFEFDFPDLPDPVKHKYLLLTKISTKKYQEEGDTEETSDKEKSYNEKIETAVARLIVRGIPQIEIADMFGFNKNKIYDIARKKGVRKRDIRQKLYDDKLYKEMDSKESTPEGVHDFSSDTEDTPLDSEKNLKEEKKKEDLIKDVFG